MLRAGNFGGSAFGAGGYVGLDWSWRQLSKSLQVRTALV